MVCGTVTLGEVMFFTAEKPTAPAASKHTPREIYSALPAIIFFTLFLLSSFSIITFTSAIIVPDGDKNIPRKKISKNLKQMFAFSEQMCYNAVRWTKLRDFAPF